MVEIPNYAAKMVPLLRQKAVHNPYDYFIENAYLSDIKIFIENQWIDQSERFLCHFVP